MNKNFDEDDYHYMNNTNKSSAPRVIQIPVQHFGSSNSNSGVNSGSLPKTTIGFDGTGIDKLKHNQDFFNRNPNHPGIFDEFQSPFGKLIDFLKYISSLFGVLLIPALLSVLIKYLKCKSIRFLITYSLLDDVDMKIASHVCHKFYLFFIVV